MIITVNKKLAIIVANLDDLKSLHCGVGCSDDMSKDYDEDGLRLDSLKEAIEEMEANENEL